MLGGELFGIHGASDTALALLQKASELDPVSYSCYQVIGEYYIGVGKLLKAETAISKGNRSAPDGPGVAFSNWV